MLCLSPPNFISYLLTLVLTNRFLIAVIKAWGMLDYARDRYGTFDGNLKNWNWDETVQENIGKNIRRWGYMPGIALEVGKDYSKYLKDVPEKNKKRVVEALWFVHKYCSSSLAAERASLDVPDEWKTAYDARPWVAYPERK